eukprot:PhF_6_TR11323/c0_g1_i1/m.18284/K13111/SMU1; WD40 repeat-containing protein SMU1
MTLEIDSRDVIQVVMQYLAENGLHNSLSALHEETNVSLDAVPSIHDLKHDIVNGFWADVMQKLSYTRLPPSQTYELYEHIIQELHIAGETEVARRVLYESSSMQALRLEDYPRFARIEDSLVTFGGIALSSQETVARRKKIAEDLCRAIQVVPEGRLVGLISDAVKYRQAQGSIRSSATHYNVFTGLGFKKEDEAFMERPPTILEKVSTMTNQTSVECLSYTPNGLYLVTGALDGFVEVWDPSSGELRMDLGYQGQGLFMRHDDAVLCLCVHSDSDVFAAGSNDGTICTWRIASGQCTRRYERAHANGVAAVHINNEATMIVSGSFDGTVRIHSMVHQHLLAELTGHKSYVNAVSFILKDDCAVVSGSSDGTLKVWSQTTPLPIVDVPVPNGDGSYSPECAVISLTPFHKRQEKEVDGPTTCLVGVRSTCAYSFAVSASGAHMKTKYILPPSKSGAKQTKVLRCVDVSGRGKYVALGCNDGHVVVYDSVTGKIVGDVTIPIPEGTTTDIVSIKFSPQRNQLCVAVSDGTLHWYRSSE